MAKLKISKELLQAKFLPAGAFIDSITAKDEYIECEIYGPEVPNDANTVHVVVEQTIRIMKDT